MKHEQRSFQSMLQRREATENAELERSWLRLNAAGPGLAKTLGDSWPREVHRPSNCQKACDIFCFIAAIDVGNRADMLTVCTKFDKISAVSHQLKEIAYMTSISKAGFATVEREGPLLNAVLKAPTGKDERFGFRGDRAPSLHLNPRTRSDRRKSVPDRC